MDNGMSDKSLTTTSETSAWKNESARQRWELFHRAIAHAKASNVANMDQEQAVAEAHRLRPPYLYLAK